MNQTSTAAAIATVIGAYTGLFAMIGFLMYATRAKSDAMRSRRPASAPARDEARADALTGTGGAVVGPRRAADDAVTAGRV